MAVTLGPRHVLAWHNAATRQVFGVGRVGESLVDTLGALGQAWGRQLDAVFQSGEAARYERRTLATNDRRGERVALSYSLHPLRDAAGIVDGVIFIGVDITGEVSAAQAAERSELLAGVSAAVAGAAEPAAALQAFTDCLVPRLADFAAVYLTPANDRGAVQRVPPPVASLAPSLAALGSPPTSAASGEPSPWEPALRAGSALIIPVDAQVLDRASEPVRRWINDAGAHSIAVMPMVVAGELNGVLLLLAARGRAPFSPVDLGFLSDVTARAAAAVTAQYNEARQRAISLQLQQALLPPEPPPLRTLTVAAHYSAGSPDVEVGGDWWDVYDVGAGRVALGVGDVSGRGVAAAAMMGQARAAMRAAGHARLDPAEVLAVLDAQLNSMVYPQPLETGLPPRFATACYAVYEPALNLLRAANAGHLPLLVRATTGEVRSVSLPPAAPLGLLAAGFEEVEVEFEPGETLAFVTDGLIESRESDLDHGMAALAEALGRHGGDADLHAAVGRIIADMSRLPGYGRDDAVLLLARAKGLPAGEAFGGGEAAGRTRRLRSGGEAGELHLHSATHEVARARRFVRELAVSWGLASGRVDDLELVASELVTNAVTHTTGEVFVQLGRDEAGDGDIVLAVRDTSSQPPRPRAAGTDEPTGRGLGVVAALATSWGVEAAPHAGGKTVWARLAPN